MRNKIYILTFFALVFSQYDWIDNGVPVRQGIHIEWQRTGDKGNNGEMIFAWSDTRYVGRDIYAQKVDVNGSNQWGSEGSPVVIAPGRQEDPILISDGSGGAFIIWRDYRNEPADGDIYAQHVQSDGSVSWDITGVPLTVVPGEQVSLNMASDGMGGVFVIWNDLSVATLGHTYGTHLTTDPNDIIAPGEGVPLISNDSAHNGVSIETAEAGSAIMVWADNRNIDTSGFDIYTQRVDINCNTLWSTPEEGGIPLCMADGSQEYAKITHYSETASVIVWEDKRYDEDSGDIFIQYIDMDGNLLLDDAGEEICTDVSNQIKPRVKADSQGAYIVWEDERYTIEESDIFVQRHVLGEGSIFVENGLGICTASNTQDQPRLTVDGNGGAYIVWMDERYAPFPEIEIFMQHINQNGETSFDDQGLIVCDAQGFQFNPLVRNDGYGNVFALWGDMRTGSIGLHAQHISPSNGINLEENGIELYWGMDGNALKAQSLYLGNNESLIYWEDHREGIYGYYSFGQKIYSGWENVVEPNGLKLCNNAAQLYPQAGLSSSESDITLGFLKEPTADSEITEYTLYYQPLNNNLEMIGETDQGFPVFESGTSQNEFDMSLSDDENLFFAFSDVRNYIDKDIYLQKYNNFNPVFAEPILLIDNYFVDDELKYISSTPSNGCFITYNSAAGDTRANAILVDSDGSIIGESIRLSTVEQDQFIKGLVKTDLGFFVIWEDQRFGSADIYGQFVSFDGDLLGPQDGIPITIAANDQLKPSITYNSILNEIMVCWEDFRNGLDYDIYCATINETTLEVLTIDLSVDSGNQKAPFVYAALYGSYLFAWEDSRGSVTSDIYYQSMSGENFNHPINGIVLCDADFNQFTPEINLYNEDSNSYMIYWRDSRSNSTPEDIYNLYAQSVTIEVIHECDLFDVNSDGIINIIDIVLILNIIFGITTPNDIESCSADINGDEIIDVLDIVLVVIYIFDG